MNSYVAYVFRRVPNSRYTKFGLNRLRGKRVNLEHTNKQTHTHSLLFIRRRKKKKKEKRRRLETQETLIMLQSASPTSLYIIIMLFRT
jgi:hypothetical protein